MYDDKNTAVLFPLCPNYILTRWGQDKMAAIFQTTFSNAFSWMKIYQYRLKFHWRLSLGPINNIPALVQIMAWRRAGDKSLSEPMMVSLLTHICVTRPQWVYHPVAKRESFHEVSHRMLRENIALKIRKFQIADNNMPCKKIKVV